MREYHIPPDDYGSPSMVGCKTCGQPIVFVPLMGGVEKWVHLSNSDHEVVMPYPWWDTLTGKYVEGPERPRSADSRGGEV